MVVVVGTPVSFFVDGAIRAKFGRADGAMGHFHASDGSNLDYQKPKGTWRVAMYAENAEGDRVKEIWPGRSINHSGVHK